MSNLSNGNGNSKGSPIMYFIDATNVCYWKDTNNPSLSPLLHLVIHLRRELNQSFFCIFDANTIYKIPDHEKEIYNNLLKYPEFFYKVAGGKRADDFVLELADKYDAPVISNDNYNGEQYEKYKWKDRDYQPQRLFMGEVIPVMGNHHLILSDLDIHLVLNQPVDILYSILTQLLTTSSANRKAGKVKFFNAHEGWGQITYTADIYFHRSVVPFGNELGKDQSIEFTIGQNEKGACVSQIFMVAPKEKTRIGYIESYDEAKEIGSIKTIDEDQTSTMFFYKSYFGDNIDPAQISAGKIVEFTKSKNKHGDCARDIIILDDTTTGKLLKIQRKRLQKMDGMMEQFTKLQTAYEQKQQEWKRIEEKSTDLRKLEEMLKARDNTILQIKKQRDEFKEKLRLLNGGEMPELSPEMLKADSNSTEQPTPEALPQQKTENNTPATPTPQPNSIKADKQESQKQQNKQQPEKQQTSKNNQNATQNSKKQPATQPTLPAEESITTAPPTITKPEQPATPPESNEKIPGLIVLPKKQSEQPKKEIQPTEKQLPAAELPSEIQKTIPDVPQTTELTPESVVPKTGLIILPKKQNQPPVQTPTAEQKPQEEKKQPAVLSEQPDAPAELPAAASNTTLPVAPSPKTNNNQGNNKPNKKAPAEKQPQKEKHKPLPQSNANPKSVQKQPELPIPSSPSSSPDKTPNPPKVQPEVKPQNEKKTPVPTANPTTTPAPSKNEPKEGNNSRQRWWNTLDEEWKKAFNVTLGKGESTDSPSNEELDSLLNTTKLNFYRTSKHRLTFKLSSLEGIKLLPKLQAINVSDHAIASIGELAPNLSRLNQLNISGNPLADSEKEQIKQLKIASLKI